MSRSLGTLTLDLVARTGGWVQGMDKSQRTSRQWKRQVEKDMKQVGLALKAVTAAALAKAAALGVMARRGMESIDAQAKLARGLGGSVTALQALERAAGRAGVETGELQSATLRLNQRLGQAVIEGGAAERALSRIGLSARQLIGMDIDERMATLSDAMRDAGLNSQEMSYTLRELGIRQARIVNLMQDGGDAIRESRTAIEELGAAVNDIDARMVEAANDAMAEFGIITQGVQNRLAIELAPILELISTRITDAVREAGGFGEVISRGMERAARGAGFVLDAIDGVRRVINLAGSGIALMVIDARRDFLRLADTIYSGPINALNALIRQMNRVPGLEIGPVDQFGFVDGIRQDLATFEEASRIARQDMQDILMAPMASESLNDFLKEVDSRREEFASLADSIDGATGAADDFADTLKQFSPSMSEEVQGILDRAGPGSRIDAEGQIRDAWGNTLPSLQRELDAELKKQINDFQSQQNLQEGLKAAAQQFIDSASEAVASAWSSISPAGPAGPGGVAQTASAPRWSTDLGGGQKVSEAAAQVAGGGVGGGAGQHLGTLRLASDAGEIDVQGSADQLTKWLADTLSGVAAGSS